MAILKSTTVNGDLTVTGSLNVQGNLTYVGVENLRVKDHQIELNANDKGSASLAGADQAGIVIRGARNTENVSDDASILYNHADDTLVVNKTIKGTVSNAASATSADKVANKLTVNVKKKVGSGEETETVTFDGSAAETVNIDLKALQDQIDGKAAASHTHTTSEITDLNNVLAGKQDAFNNATTLAGITSTQVTNWDDAAAKAHIHDNKTVLDDITAEKVAAWDGAVSAAGVSSVGGKAGALTLKGGSATLGDVNLSISDTGEISAAIVPDSFDVKGAADDALDAAKTYANGLAKNYDAAGAATQALADAKDYTDTKIGELGLGNAARKNVLEGAIAASPSSKDLVTAAQVKEYADGLNTTMDGRVKVLEAIDHNKLAADASADAVAKVLDGAPESFDTLKEVAAWIADNNHAATVAELVTDVNNLKQIDHNAYVAADAATLASAKEYADGLNTTMNGRVDALEGKSHTHTNMTELNKIEDGDKKKWDDHVANGDIHVTAQQKADWNAKQNALTKTQLDAVNSGITATKVSTLESASHTHANKAELDKIKDGDKAKWDDAFAKAHEHANKTVLDGITAKKVADWDGAKNYADEKVSALSGSVATTDAAQDTKIANIKSDITSIQSDITGIQSDITGIKDGTTLDGRYVNVSGDTMTGDLTMPSSGNKGIIFGDMKIVWNDTDKAIEFVPTTPTTA